MHFIERRNWVYAPSTVVGLTARKQMRYTWIFKIHKKFPQVNCWVFTLFNTLYLAIANFVYFAILVQCYYRLPMLFSWLFSSKVHCKVCFGAKNLDFIFCINPYY